MDSLQFASCHLFDQLQVPIGLIESAWGGTPVEAWSPEQSLENCDVPQSPDLGANVQGENSELWHAKIAPLTRLTVKAGNPGRERQILKHQMTSHLVWFSLEQMQNKFLTTIQFQTFHLFDQTTQKMKDLFPIKYF